MGQEGKCQFWCDISNILDECSNVYVFWLVWQILFVVNKIDILADEGAVAEVSIACESMSVVK